MIASVLSTVDSEILKTTLFLYGASYCSAFIGKWQCSNCSLGLKNIKNKEMYGLLDNVGVLISAGIILFCLCIYMGVFKFSQHISYHDTILYREIQIESGQNSFLHFGTINIRGFIIFILFLMPFIHGIQCFIAYLDRINGTIYDYWMFCIKLRARWKSIIGIMIISILFFSGVAWIKFQKTVHLTNDSIQWIHWILFSHNH